MGRLRGWGRTGLTGIAFLALFGGGGLLGITLLPLLALGGGDRAARTRRLIGATFRCYLAALRGLGLIRLTVEGRAALMAAGGCIVIANHPTLLDVVLLMAAIPEPQCIVKHEFWERGVLGGLVRRAGYLRNDLPPEAMLAACRAALQAGAGVIVFPEGTRSRPGIAPRFTRGFAQLALACEAPLLPVLIACDPPTLAKGAPWWHVPARTPHFRLWAGPMLRPAARLAALPRGRAARRLNEALQACYISGAEGNAGAFLSALDRMDEIAPR